MGSDKNENRLGRAYDEYLRLLGVGMPYGAYVQIGDILNYIEKTGTVSRRKKYEWIDKIRSIDISNEDLDLLKQGVVSDFERAMVILAHGSRYNDDEYVLLLTLLCQIRSVGTLLDYGEIRHQKTDIEKLIGEIAGTLAHESNEKEFRSAVSQMKRNGSLVVASDFDVFGKG